MITLKEATRNEFEEFLKQYLLYKNLNNMLALQFSDYPFDFQSGVFTAYLRSVGIEAEANKVDNEYQSVVFLSNIPFPGYHFCQMFPTHPEALTAAINAALELREQQLTFNQQPL